MEDQPNKDSLMVSHYQQQLDQIYDRANLIANNFFETREHIRDNTPYSEWGTVTLFVRKRLRPVSGLVVPIIEWQNIQYYGKRPDGTPRRRQTHIKRDTDHQYTVKAFRKHNPAKWQVEWIQKYEPIYAELRRQVSAITTLARQVSNADKLLGKSEARLEIYKLDDSIIDF